MVHERHGLPLFLGFLTFQVGNAAEQFLGIALDPDNVFGDRECPISSEIKKDDGM